jgi:hypothetical protein
MLAAACMSLNLTMALQLSYFFSGTRPLTQAAPPESLQLFANLRKNPSGHIDIIFSNPFKTRDLLQAILKESPNLDLSVMQERDFDVIRTPPSLRSRHPDHISSEVFNSPSIPTATFPTHP